MEWINSFTMAIFLFGPCCFAQTPPNAVSDKSATLKPEFSLVVAPPAGPIRLGVAINVSVTVTNVSGKEIYWATESPDTPYRAFDILLKKDGQKVETTVFHRKITGTQRPDDPADVELGNATVSPIPPGKSFTLSIDLTRLYQITERGAFTLDVGRYDEDTKTAVHSNTLILNIEPEFSIVVTPPAGPIRLGMPIDLSVTVTNISGKVIYWEAESPDTAYRAFDISLKKAGQEVETTVFYRKITSTQRPDDPADVEVGNATVSPIAPGKSFTFDLDLKRLYQIKLPGEYTLEVSCYDDTKTSVFSNTLTLNIVP